MALLPTLSVEHHQRLLDLARAQHVEWQRLLEQLTEREVAEPTRQDRTDQADQASCSKLSSTSTVKPPEPVEDLLSTLSADDNRREADVMEEHEDHFGSLGDTPQRAPVEARGAASPSISTAAPITMPKNKVLRWIQPKLNYIAGTLVVLNTILMFVELELEGQATARTMGRDTGIDFPPVEQYLRWLDGFFDIAFLLELIVRVLCDRGGWRFFLELSNQLESILVIFGIVDLFVIIGHFGERDDAMILHLMRSAHALRALRTCRLFKGLRVLLRACESFITSLFWAMVLLLIFMSAGSILMGNLLQSYINSDANADDRTWVWEYYGTAYRCWYTMYELTFAGNWPTRARPVTDNVDARFAIFFFTYITVVSFAMIRVVTAVFLKDTLEAAQNDQELQLLNQLKKKAEYVKKLEVIFEAIGDGNGIIKEERLLAVMADPQVRAHLQTLDLDVHEGTALFHLLDNGDGEVTLEEFIDGILRCKGPARAVDQVAMHAEIRQMDMKIMKVLRLISSMPSSSWGSPSNSFGAKIQSDVSTHLMAFSDLRQLPDVTDTTRRDRSRVGSKSTVVSALPSITKLQMS